jgi:hypothetical protein
MHMPLSALPTLHCPDNNYKLTLSLPDEGSNKHGSRRLDAVVTQCLLISRDVAYTHFTKP